MNAAQSNYVVEPPPVATPTAKSQEMVLVRRSELSALKRGIGRAVADPAESASGWTYSWLGVGVAATLSLLALVGPRGNHVRTWIVEAHIAAMVVGYFLAWFMSRIARRQRAERTSAHDEVCAEIDELDQRAPTSLSDEAAA
jgi:hypothetical protein